MMEVDSTEPFKAPPLPISKDAPSLAIPKVSSTSVEHVSRHLNTECLDILTETIMPDEAPNSPVQRAEAETKISITHPTLHYTAPPWACIPEKGLGYKLEVVKSGTIVDCYDLDKRKHDTFVVIGRLPNCDIVLDHPSISRYHCILQYGDDQIGKTGKGWHIYDMGSTHGTKANKNKLPPKQHIRIRVGFVLQFGGSSRIFSLLGPDQDCESEWDCSPSEMREKMLKKAIEAKAAAAAKRELEEERLRESQMSEGIDWGMRFDEDTPAPSVDFELDGHLMEDREQYYQSDPKKALAKFFEREGFDMTFQLTEQGSGHTHKWLCAIELPIEVSGVDRTYTAQAIVSTSKKDAQVQCALEACRILDAHGVLRSSKAKSRTKKNDLEANDFYDSDEDEYLDRTGQIERQREKRMLWAKNQSNEKATKKSTYESLLKELEETRENITQLKQKLDEMHTVKASTNTGDSLDDYCRQLSEGHGVVPDLKAKTETSVLRQRLVALTHDAQRLEKLVKIAKPVALPELKMAGTNSSGADKQAFLRKTMMIGRKKASDLKAPAASTASNIVKGPAADVPFRPEVEGDDGDDEPTNEIAGPSTVAVDEKKPETTQRAQQPQQPPVAEKSTDQVPEPKTSEKFEQREPAKLPIAEPEVEQSPTSPESSQGVEHRSVDVSSSEERKSDKRSLLDEQANSEAEAAKKRRRVRIRANRPAASDPNDDYGSIDDDRYATWLPPDNQSGDGKTALNAKFEGRY